MGTTLRYLIQRNPHLHIFLEKILFELALIQLKKAIKTKQLRQIHIDIDQTDREVYGKQNGAVKGYSAKGKGKTVYQCAVWTFRELKLVFKLELRPGNNHCAKDFLKKLKPVIEELKKLKLRIIICCDSGYENQAVFKYLDSQNVEFIFAKRQTKKIKKRGKNAKNRRIEEQGGIVFKERKLEIKSKKGSFHFREIFIQNRIIVDSYGQMYFKNFDSDEFTTELPF